MHLKTAIMIWILLVILGYKLRWTQWYSIVGWK